MTAKEKKALYDKEYKEKNREKKRLQSKKYYEDNKELLSLKKKDYYINNKKHILNRCSNYRENNPKEKTGLTGTGNYNITLAERYKEEWLNIPIFLYKLKTVDFNGKTFYKYGLTKNLKNRLYTIPYNMEVIELHEMNKYDAVYKEKELLEKVTKYKPLTKFGGYTECFIK